LPWDTQVVITHARRRPLPDFKSKGGKTDAITFDCPFPPRLTRSAFSDDIHSLCTIKADFTSLPLGEFEKQRKHWWPTPKNETYYEARYTIRFLFRPASIDTKLLFKGRIFNEPNSFSIVWDSGADVAAPRAHRQHRDHSLDRRGSRRFPMASAMVAFLIM
jgi:hypothetical protein